MEEIFLIVNPKSGGNKGEVFLRAPQPFKVLVNGKDISLRIYSILDGASGSKPGFVALKKAIAGRSSPIRCVVGGGDGTVMWADSECEKTGINSSKDVIFGIVPLGTGNDFARSKGWGGTNPQGVDKDDWELLKKFTRWWATATPGPHDVWNVKINVDQANGQILTVNSDKVEEDTGKKIVEGNIVNYFSIGQESKAGIDFDKHRTKSQLGNLLVYAFAGAKNTFSCGQWDHVDHIIEYLKEGDGPDGKFIFNQCRDDSLPDIKGSPESLMFLNINSYAGGKAHFWGRDQPIGLEPEPDDLSKLDVDSAPGDGRLEVVVLPRLMDIAIDGVVHGASRIWSGGPYYLKFNDDTDDTPDDFEAWVQIDGEFYHLVDPVDCTITLKKKINTLFATAEASRALGVDEEFDEDDDGA